MGLPSLHSTPPITQVSSAMIHTGRAARSQDRTHPTHLACNEPPPMTTALVHIGVPKTGTTSFQDWIYRNRAQLLADRGVTLYDGFVPQIHRAQIHPELLLLSQRPERDCQSKRMIPQWSTQAWQQAARTHLADQVCSDADTMLFTLEGLFLLRHEDEVERLAELLAPREVRVAVCLREPASFLSSYRAQMAKNDVALSDDPTSHLHLEDGTWLTDWADMLAVWRSVLGSSNVVELSYEQAMAEHGGTTQGILEAFGIAPDGLPSMNSAVRNRSGNAHLNRIKRRVVKRVRRFVV